MKRAFDISFSIFVLLLIWPLIAVLFVLVRFKLGPPALFRQVRPGMHGRPFEMLKFRTMADIRDVNGSLYPDKDRLTGFGKFLRSTSLDELPELWNVLNGDMSLVGPRPLLMRYLPRYSIDQRRRHEIRPGITGWAQVMGRNSISWEEKFVFDVWYVDNRSFLLDIQILFLTLVRVFERKGIAASGDATMPEFLGSDDPK